MNSKTILFSLFFLVVFLFLIPFVSSELTGIGISPSCFPSSSNGCGNIYYNFTQHLTNMNESLIVNFRVYNFDDITRNFTVEIVPENCNISYEHITLINDNLTTPKYFVLSKNIRGMKCFQSPGCQEVNITIPYKFLKSGNCVLKVLVISPEYAPNTMLKINQIIGSKIYIHKEEDFLVRNKNKIFIIFLVLLILLFIYKIIPRRKNLYNENFNY